MSQIRLVVQSLIPWVIFFSLYNYGLIELKITIISNILFISIFNFSSLRRGFVFDWGSLIFFIFLLLITIVFQLGWFILNADLMSIYALTTIVWLSILIKKPIIMQYAQLTTAKELWATQFFYRTYNITTFCWAVILTTIAFLNTIQLFIWGATIWLAELLPILLLLLGIWFTFWFPDWYKRNVIGEWGVINLRNLSNLNIAHANIASIAYRTLGKGEKLILLPASYMNMYTWDPTLIRKLAKKYQVVILDYPNIGDSQLKQGEFTVNNLAAALYEFINNFTDQRISLLGYAMGGWIAQQIAIRYPKKIKNLVLIATNIGSQRTAPKEQDTIQLIENFRFPTYKTINQSTTLMKIMFPTNKIKVMLPKIRALFSIANFSEDALSATTQLSNGLKQQWYNGKGTYYQLGEIEATTLVIAGSQDKIVDRQNAALLTNNIRGAKLIEIVDAGHGIIYEYPNRIATAILNL